MQKIKQTYQKGAAGVANVIVDPAKELVRISFITGENSGESFKLDLDNVPEYARTGRFYVSLSGKNDSVFSYYPAVGTFVVKFKKWATRENTVATPQEKVGQYGPYSYMIALLQIFKGENKGMEIPLFLNYKFVNDGQDNVAIPTSEKSGTAAERLLNFLDAVGILEEVIPYSDNLLPALAKRILKKDRPFNVVMKEGRADYISSLEGVSMEGEVIEDAEDEKPGTTDPDEDTDDPEQEAEDDRVNKTSTAKSAKGKIRPDPEDE
jgi:hypothetical protein